jgi:hypothetical protein
VNVSFGKKQSIALLGLKQRVFSFSLMQNYGLTAIHKKGESYG